MRLDSHQHFWTYNESDYDWMTSEMDVLRRNYLPFDLLPELISSGFDGSISVQARRMVEETEFLLQLADQCSSIRGVVGWVDFESEQIDETLDRFASHSRFKGVRELIHDMEDVDYACSDNHIQIIGKLGSLNLTYDLLLKPSNLPSAIELVRRFPEQKFVIDHIAKPVITDDISTHWREGIESLSQFENVFCKLSGMVTEARWEQWCGADFLPYLEIVLDAFGPTRLMIGSDWPVCLLSASYSDTMGIVLEFIDSLSPDEQGSILGGTCAEFYNVEDVTPAHQTMEMSGDLG